MMPRLLASTASLSTSALWLWTLAATAAIELPTIFLRFGLGLESTKNTGFIGKLTFGIRIHHGYVGALMVLIALFTTLPPAYRNALLIIGGGMFLSDMIHHFLVLWPITGSPHFDLVYPSN